MIEDTIVIGQHSDHTKFVLTKGCRVVELDAILSDQDILKLKFIFEKIYDCGISDTREKIAKNLFGAGR